MSFPLFSVGHGFRCGFLASLLCLCSLNFSFAHGDLHDQIEAVTRQIQKSPQEGELYFKRGELHRAHRDWDASQADYEMAAVLSPHLVFLDLARGRMFLDADWPRSAIVCLDRFLLKQPRSADALVLRARAWMKLESFLEAASDFDEAIAAAEEPKPEYYLERAQALQAAGPRHIPRAIRGLDEGMQKLGPLVVLQLQAIELELARNEFQAALDRIDVAAAKAPRKETWLLRRGEVLARAGRTEEARESLSSALAALNTLPSSRRNVPAMVALEERITSLQQQLADAKAPNGSASPE
jgi:tetratricopeptide (TPR) repeat protein